jgi:peptidoglycan/xylan/chitin deacetylase (PgdA/CDA1 family)
MWSTAGQFVGNHSASHQSLATPNMTLNAFIADVLRADTAFRSLKTWLPLLRFPYLQEGETREKRDGMRRWLHEHNYRPAPVSIETVDWFYNSRFLDLEKNPQPEKLSALKQDYLAHVLECANFYDAQAQRVLGRSPLHVMLLHVNALNAAMLPDIIDTFKARGWTFISTKTAFDDPLYLEQPDSLPAGGSLIAALAQERGEKVFNTRVKSERDNPCLKNRSSID